MNIFSPKRFFVVIVLLIGGGVFYSNVARAGLFDSLWTRPNLFSVAASRLLAQFSNSAFFTPVIIIDHLTPNITKITPSEVYRDPPRWIDSVMIDGSDFVPPNAGYTNVGKTTVVYFDGQPIPTSVLSSTQIQASIPKSLLESLTAIGTHKITAFNPTGSKTSQAIDFVIKPLPPSPATIITGGGATGLAETIYIRAKTPVVNDVRLERLGGDLQLRVKGLNFEESQIMLNGQSLLTTRDGDDLVATISPAIRSGLVYGDFVDVQVVNGKSRATLEGTNFTADAGVVVIGGDGVEQTLSSIRVDGKIEADISMLTPGKHTIYVSSGIGKNRTLSPGQEINISGAQ